MWQKLKNFFCPPHKCNKSKQFHWLLKEGVKVCGICGKRYNIRDGKLIEKPPRIHVDYK